MSLLSRLLAKREALQKLRVDTFNPMGPNAICHRRLNRRIGGLSVKIEAARIKNT